MRVELSRTADVAEAFQASGKGYVIETDLTDEEKALIAAGVQEYRENSDSFTSLDDCITEWEKLHKH
ncbi:MAG: hypothetical protein LBK46_04995 [Oscillospiraceae bacterium]|jgi:hypothetical protein|nr:hypothetical protein [Oscillospiraceae bacterium]